MAARTRISSPSILLDPPAPQPRVTPDTTTRPASIQQSPAKRNKKGKANATGASSKPKQTKSRGGCHTCKQKRLKCDETKPSCLNCVHKNLVCGGYKKIFQWRPREKETFFTEPVVPRRRKNCSVRDACKSPQASPAVSFTPNFSNGTQLGAPSWLDPLLMQPPISPLDPHVTYLGPPIVDDYSVQTFSYIHGLPESIPILADDTLDDDTPPKLFGTQSELSPSQTPRLDEFVMPSTDVIRSTPEYMDEWPEQFKIGCQSVSAPDSEEEVEEIPRVSDQDKSLTMSFPSPSRSSSSSSSGGSFFEFVNLIYAQPSFSIDDSDLLGELFDSQTCKILSIYNDDKNPWMKMRRQLGQQEPALFHALNALTAFHATKERPNLKSIGIREMTLSLRCLHQNISNMRTDVAVATSLALAFCESWDQHIFTGIAHLRGARVALNQAVENHRQNNWNIEDSKRLEFLCSTWVYMDVIARLTSIDEDNSEDFSTILAPLCSPDVLSCEVDSLMGCAKTLFPLIGRVANLVHKVRTTDEISLDIIEKGANLKFELEAWEVPAGFRTRENLSPELEYSLRTAEAYRSATILYLGQAVLEVASEQAHILANSVLRNLAAIPIDSNTIILHIYPLLAAGCEAVTCEDREFVIRRWGIMMERLAIGNVDRCWEVTLEVWARRDSQPMQSCLSVDEIRFENSVKGSAHWIGVMMALGWEILLG